MYVCERSFADPLIYILRSHVQKCGYQFISAFERRRVLDTPVTKRNQNPRRVKGSQKKRGDVMVNTREIYEPIARKTFETALSHLFRTEFGFLGGPAVIELMVNRIKLLCDEY